MKELIACICIYTGFVFVVLFCMTLFIYPMEVSRYKQISKVTGYAYTCDYPTGCLIQSPTGWVEADVIVKNKKEVTVK